MKRFNDFVNESNEFSKIWDLLISPVSQNKELGKMLLASMNINNKKLTETIFENLHIKRPSKEKLEIFNLIADLDLSADFIKLLKTKLPKPTNIPWLRHNIPELKQFPNLNKCLFINTDKMLLSRTMDEIPLFGKYYPHDMLVILDDWGHDKFLENSSINYTIKGRSYSWRDGRVIIVEIETLKTPEENILIILPDSLMMLLKEVYENGKFYGH